MGSLEPRAVARLGDVGVHRLPVLRGRDGRGVLRRSLGKEARDAGELGVGDLAALAISVGGADAETECGGSGKKISLLVYPCLARDFWGSDLDLGVGAQ